MNHRFPNQFNPNQDFRFRAFEQSSSDESDNEPINFVRPDAPRAEDIVNDMFRQDPAPAGPCPDFLFPPPGKSLAELQAEFRQATPSATPQATKANVNLPSFFQQDHVRAPKSTTEQMLHLMTQGRVGFTAESTDYTSRARRIANGETLTPMERLDFKPPTDQVRNSAGELITRPAGIDFVSSMLATLPNNTEVQRELISALKQHAMSEADKDLFSKLYYINKQKKDLEKIDLPTNRMLIHTCSILMLNFDFLKRFFVYFQQDLKNCMPEGLLDTLGLAFSVQRDSSQALATMLETTGKKKKYALLESHIRLLPVVTEKTSGNPVYDIFSSDLKTVKSQAGTKRDQKQMERNSHSSRRRGRKRKRKHYSRSSAKRQKFRRTRDKGARSYQALGNRGKKGKKKSGKNASVNKFINNMNESDSS